jgi:hypothetical protein
VPTAVISSTRSPTSTEEALTGNPRGFAGAVFSVFSAAATGCSAGQFNHTNTAANATRIKPHTAKRRFDSNKIFPLMLKKIAIDYRIS